MAEHPWLLLFGECPMSYSALRSTLGSSALLLWGSENF